jgi:hypothetical protein
MDWVFGSGPGSFGIWGRIFGGSAEINKKITATLERFYMITVVFDFMLQKQKNT